jgi:hypothetical protein
MIRIKAVLLILKTLFFESKDLWAGISGCYICCPWIEIEKGGPSSGQLILSLNCNCFAQNTLPSFDTPISVSFSPVFPSP